MVVAFTILLDIVQLGLFFPDQQRDNGRGDCKFQNVWYITVDNNDISCAAEGARIWQFSAAYPHNNSTLPDILNIMLS